MRTTLLPLLLLTYLITASPQPDYDEELSNCRFDAKYPYIPPPDWKACHDLLDGLPNPWRPETIPKVVMWPIVLSNMDCTIVMKPNIDLRSPTSGDSLSWAQIHRQATMLIFKCFREARPAHLGDMFMRGFLTEKQGFPPATGNSGLAMLVISTPYDRATHNLGKVNAQYSKNHLKQKSHRAGTVPDITLEVLRNMPIDHGNSNGNPVSSQMNDKKNKDAVRQRSVSQ